MNEDAFFANMAKRLGRRAPLDTSPNRDVVGAPEFWKERSGTSTELIETFQRELESLGGEAQVIPDTEALRKTIQNRLTQMNPHRVGCWGGDFLDQYDLRDILAPYPVVKWGESGVEEYKSVDISISGCAYAVADTGTIVMMSSPERGRSVAVLPSVHMVILEASQIRLRLGEVLAELARQKSDLPSSIHFISGPSRSSDIENDQTIGIHGPAAVIVYIVESR